MDLPLHIGAEAPSFTLLPRQIHALRTLIHVLFNFRRLQPLGEARQALRQSTAQLKGTVKLHALQLAAAWQSAAKANISAQAAELRRLDTEYAQLLASCTTPGPQ